MDNKNKHIEYWIKNAESDLDTARLLLENKKVLHSLFFCHLVIEKTLKALVLNYTNDFAPKSHNLIFLTDKSGITLAEEFEDFTGILMKYQLEGRYPDFNPDIPNIDKANEFLRKTNELHIWLKKKL